MPPSDKTIELVIGEFREGIHQIREDVRAHRTAFDLHKDDVIVRLDRLEQENKGQKKTVDIRVTSVVALLSAALGGIMDAVGHKIFK